MLIKIVDDDQAFVKKIKDIVYDNFKDIFLDYSIDCITSNFEAQYFEKGDILLLQNEINELDYIIDRAYEKHMMIILNPSPFDNALENCDLSKISLFLMNEIEGFQITGEKEPDKILTKVKALYPKAKVVLTLGGDGSVYQDETGIYRQGIFKVKAVDTTAAGDTFTGYFISSIIDGLPVQDGLELAAKASAIAVSRPGATASIPLRSEVVKEKSNGKI